MSLAPMLFPFFSNDFLFKIKECLDSVVTLFSQLVQLLLTHQDLPFQCGEPLLWRRRQFGLSLRQEILTQSQ